MLCCQALNLGRSWWTVASQIATLANFYLTTWEEFHTGERSHRCTHRSTLNLRAGQLYLGVFSGPVEGILMIVTIYIVTGLRGM